MFTGYGLIWDIGSIKPRGKETIEYTLRLPSVIESTTYELKTVVEYQTFEDFLTLEETSYLTVNPEGKVKLAEGNESKSVKAKGKGYSKVHWGRPSFKGGDGASPGKKKGHDKDKGTPDNPGKPDKPPKEPGPPENPRNPPDEPDDSSDDNNPPENPGNPGQPDNPGNPPENPRQGDGNPGNDNPGGGNPGKGGGKG